MSRTVVGVLAVILFVPGLGRAQRSPVLAVFEIEDQTHKLAPAAVQQLTSYLAARLAAGDAFRVVPSSQIKERLGRQKRASYRTCYDQQCQIELGRELAADKTVSTQVIQLGSRCAVVSTLYDLRSATTERAASEKAGCAQDEFVEALEKVAETLKQPRSAASPGLVAVRSEPQGAAVFVDGKRVGETPVELRLPAGRHQVKLELRDRAPVTRQVSVKPGQLVVVSAKLALTKQAGGRIAAEAARRRAAQLALVRSHELERERGALRARRRAKTVWGYSALGAGAACLAVAGALYGVGFSQRASGYDAYHAADAPEKAAEMDEHWAEVTAGQAKITAGHVLLGLGVAAVGFSIYELVTRPAAPRPGERSVAVGLTAGPGRGALLLSGSY